MYEVEEPLKILPVFLVARSLRLKSELNDHLDGLLYGAAAGLGFSFAENILYISNILASASTFTVLLRFVTMSMHLFCTALIGFWIGYLVVCNVQVTWKNILPALAISIAVHMTWNSLSYFLGDLVVVPILILGPVLFYYLNKLAKDALHDEMYWGFAGGRAPMEAKGRATG